MCLASGLWPATCTGTCENVHDRELGAYADRIRTEGVDLKALAAGLGVTLAVLIAFLRRQRQRASARA